MLDAKLAPVETKVDFKPVPEKSDEVKMEAPVEKKVEAKSAPAEKKDDGKLAETKEDFKASPVEKKHDVSSNGADKKIDAKSVLAGKDVVAKLTTSEKKIESKPNPSELPKGKTEAVGKQTDAKTSPAGDKSDVNVVSFSSKETVKSTEVGDAIHIAVEPDNNSATIPEKIEIAQSEKLEKNLYASLLAIKDNKEPITTTVLAMANAHSVDNVVEVPPKSIPKSCESAEVNAVPHYSSTVKSASVTLSALQPTEITAESFLPTKNSFPEISRPSTADTPQTNNTTADIDLESATIETCGHSTENTLEINDEQQPLLASTSNVGTSSVQQSQEPSLLQRFINFLSWILFIVTFGALGTSYDAGESVSGNDATVSASQETSGYGATAENSSGLIQHETTAGLGGC
ncbi:unnamed protein product [Ambrosiozyma monospora]|uniref:Unnamed protein product n=1 Tax=Ambrosiozyma monospora TaxID=43982 RepID=A0A9W6YXL0_AMBMO|nr:unnamed protein product [Ambrosiozyma monospora]